MMLVAVILKLCPDLGILLLIYLIQILWRKVVRRNPCLLDLIILQLHKLLILRRNMFLILYLHLLFLGLQDIIHRRLVFSSLLCMFFFGYIFTYMPFRCFKFVFIFFSRVVVGWRNLACHLPVLVFLPFSIIVPFLFILCLFPRLLW